MLRMIIEAWCPVAYELRCVLPKLRESTLLTLALGRTLEIGRQLSIETEAEAQVYTLTL